MSGKDIEMRPAGRQGLSAVRADPEHTPRDPFRVTASAALDALSIRWSDVYGFGYDGTGWQAWRLDGTGELLQGATPDELSAAILADLAMRGAQ